MAGTRQKHYSAAWRSAFRVLVQYLATKKNEKESKWKFAIFEFTFLHFFRDYPLRGICQFIGILNLMAKILNKN